MKKMDKSVYRTHDPVQTQRLKIPLRCHTHDLRG